MKAKEGTRVKARLVKTDGDGRIPAHCWLCALLNLEEINAARALFPAPRYLIFVCSTTQWNGRTRHFILQAFGLEDLPPAWTLAETTIYVNDVGLQLNLWQ